MDTFFKQAVTLHKSGRVSQAIGMYKQMLVKEPAQAAVNARLAIAYTQIRQARAALPHFSVAVQMLPDDMGLLGKAADCAIQCADHDKAEKWLRAYLSKAPDNLPVAEALAGVLVATHQEEEALPLIERGLKANSKSASLLNLKGLVLSRLGDLSEGYVCFTQALAAQPGHLGAIRNALAYAFDENHTEGSASDTLLSPIIPALESNYQQVDDNDGLKMNLAYILFTYYEHKNAAKAFQYLNAANDINHALTPYRHERTQTLFSRLGLSLAETLKRTSTGHELDNDAPIFILGMPRSGTTLIEQIISSHSLVAALGEVDFLRRSFEQHGTPALDDSSSDVQKVNACQATIKSYLSKVADNAGNGGANAKRFTDKMPYNFMLLGLIAVFLPNAKIIHCTRDPLETCFSVYKHNLSGSHGYTNNLVDLGKYFNAYDALMRHWKQQFGDRIYEVSYEQMVQSPELETQKLLTFCGLDMEGACLVPHNTKRIVRTASAAQVRQPIYHTSLKASASFEGFLEPLIETLNSKEGGQLEL